MWDWSIRFAIRCDVSQQGAKSVCLKKLLCLGISSPQGARDCELRGRVSYGVVASCIIVLTKSVVNQGWVKRDLVRERSICCLISGVLHLDVKLDCW